MFAFWASRTPAMKGPSVKGTAQWPGCGRLHFWQIRSGLMCTSPVVRRDRHGALPSAPRSPALERRQKRSVDRHRGQFFQRLVQVHAVPEEQGGPEDDGTVL